MVDTKVPTIIFYELPAGMICPAAYLFPGNGFQNRAEILPFFGGLRDGRAGKGIEKVLVAKYAYTPAMGKILGGLQAPLQHIVMLQPFVFAGACPFILAGIGLAKGHAHD